MTTIDPEAVKAAADFNATHPVGTELDYWRGARDLIDYGPEKSPCYQPSGRGVTTSRAYVLNGENAVVFVEGCSGCIALTHVRVVNEQEPCDTCAGRGCAECCGTGSETVASAPAVTR